MQMRKFDKLGVEVFPLGFGCMRFPTLENGKINRPVAKEMLRHAIDEGVNYVDTAFYYHDEESEDLVGEALADGYREKVYLATKSPVYDIEKPEDFDRLLDVQLKRLKTDHIDFYLLHTLNDELWQKNILPHHVIDSLFKAKAEGKIKYAGFSFHDNYEMFKTIIDAAPWDFCQIQYNYVDTDSQAETRGLEYAASKGISTVVMEPLRGGRLAVPPEQVAKVLPKDKSFVETALDFVWDRAEVALLLSGMSSPEQVADNLVYARRSAVGMLSVADKKTLEKAKAVFDTIPLVACTGCAYCVPCPLGVEIPKAFKAYNMSVYSGMRKAREEYSTLEGKADACIACGNCLSKCPQSIKIPELMPKIMECFEEK